MLTRGSGGAEMVRRATFYNRRAADDRFSIRAILYGVQFRLNSMVSHGGVSAYHMVFGRNPQLPTF